MSRRHAGATLPLALLLLAGLQASAHAATGPTESVLQLRELFEQVSGAIDAFAAGNDGLVAVGRRTAVTLFGVLLVWGLLKSWILGKGFAQLLPEFIQPVVIFGLTLWSVDHLGPIVKASVESLAGIFAETLLLPGGAPTEMDIIDRLAAASFDVVSAVPKVTGSDWINTLSAIAHQTIGFLFRLAAALLLLVAGAIAAGVMMMAKVQTALAILFAPVMIPWAMWQPSTFLFNAWLTFLIGGAMQGVMASAVASLSVQVIDKVVLVAKSLGATDAMSFVTCCVLLLMAALVGFLFTRVPSLASGLVGSAAIGLDRWNATAAATGQGVAAVGSGAVATARAGYEFGKGTFQGFTRPGNGPAAASGPANAARSPAPATGVAGLLGKTVGKGLNAGVSAVSRGAGKRDGDKGRGGGASSQAAFPASPTSHAAKPVHKPFRPPPGTRPVNRPVAGA
ncbi:type IV secretion system protein [Rhizobacter sp. LjRoot28]|uniref:type IV secretion system protein n=1 Tax=Rhizobacter sp. LjRoot28 TaxID=3342309 RepID=UPI003ECCC41E